MKITAFRTSLVFGLAACVFSTTARAEQPDNRRAGVDLDIGVSDSPRAQLLARGSHVLGERLSITARTGIGLALQFEAKAAYYAPVLIGVRLELPRIYVALEAGAQIAFTPAHTYQSQRVAANWDSSFPLQATMGLRLTEHLDLHLGATKYVSPAYGNGWSLPIGLGWSL